MFVCACVAFPASVASIASNTTSQCVFTDSSSSIKAKFGNISMSPESSIPSSFKIWYLNFPTLQFLVTSEVSSI